MRLLSFIAAALVIAALYLWVFERERVLAFARGDSVVATAEEPTDVVTDASVLASENAVRVVAARSEARAINQSVLIRGRTEAARQVDVRAETGGLVVSTPLRRGAQVAEGQLLCELDPGTRDSVLRETEARLAQARAGIPEAEARVAEAAARLEEAEINDRASVQLVEDGFASQTRVASTRAAVESARAGVQAARSGLEAAQAAITSAEAAVAAAEKDIARLSMRAPFVGLLESDTAEVGALLQPGSLCATIIQLNPIKLVGFVPETDVDRVEIGAPAQGQLASGRNVSGEVTFISRSADDTTRTFRVDVEVPNTDQSIRDGQTVEVLVAATGAQAHLIPQSALTLDNTGDLGVRTVADDSRVSFVPVSVLRDTQEGVYVTGLADIADIIVVGQEFVTDGVLVEPTFQEAQQ